MNHKKPKIAEKEKGGSYLWEIKGGNARMYLLGTVHMVPESFFPLKDEIISRFDECRNLVLEVILDDLESIKVTNDIISNSEYTYEDGDSLYNHFPREKVIRLRNYLVKNKMCSRELAQKFHKLKPEAVNSLIRHGLFKKSGINLEVTGIDYYFMNRAKELNKNVLELETAEFQRELLAEIVGRKYTIGSAAGDERKPETEGFPILDAGMFDRFSKFKVQPLCLGLMAKFAEGIYAREKLIRRQRRRLVSKNNPLVGKRDEAMCQKLEDLLKTSDSYFVAVGALHLLGEGSIIDRLQRKGYEVNRIF